MPKLAGYTMTWSRCRPNSSSLAATCAGVPDADIASTIASGTAAAIAEFDVLNCFAERAATLDCTQPELVDEPTLTIEGGRHPVVERASREPFIPNDLRFDEGRRMLIIVATGRGRMREAACGELRCPACRAAARKRSSRNFIARTIP